MKKLFATIIISTTLASCADGYLMDNDGYEGYNFRKVRDDMAVRRVHYAPTKIKRSKESEELSPLSKLTYDRKPVEQVIQRPRIVETKIIEPIPVTTTRVSHTPAGAPANARPGECYARVQKPAVYTKYSEQVKVREASVRYEHIPAEYDYVDDQVEVSPARTEYKTIPAEYDYVEDQVEVRPAKTDYKIIPAQFKTVSEQVVSKPASQRIIQIPAEYKTVTKDVVTAPARTEWRRSTAPDGSGVYVNGKFTNEVMCLVEVPAQVKKVSERQVIKPASQRVVEEPAEYKTVERRVQVKPEERVPVHIPAEYKTVKRKVVVRPETKEPIHIPAEYKTVKRRVEVSPASKRTIDIPAEYKTVERKKKLESASLSWAKVLCEENSTPEVIKIVQKALADEGHSPGPIDGIIGERTLGAMKNYQKANNLAIGQLTEEAITRLGLDFDSLIR